MDLYSAKRCIKVNLRNINLLRRKPEEIEWLEFQMRGFLQCFLGDKRVNMIHVPPLEQVRCIGDLKGSIGQKMHLLSQ